MTISPLQLAQKTPMTNCGECGYPSCFAFAAAVLKVGEDCQKCKYLDPTGLDLPTKKKGSVDDLLKDHDLALVEHLKSKIAQIDLSKTAPPIGASLINADNGLPTLSFRYLASDITINKKGILIDGQEPVDPRDQILLYNYVHSQGGRPPEDVWIGMESMPNSISKVRTLSVYAEKPLAALFASLSPPTIDELCRKSDGILMAESNADIAVTFQVLPMLPIQVHFWSEDIEEGFEAKVKMLFDRNVLDFLDIESLVFTAERLAEKLQALASQ